MYNVCKSGKPPISMKNETIEQALFKIKEKYKILEQQRSQILKVESVKHRKLRARMLIELADFLFANHYESANHQMKQNP